MKDFNERLDLHFAKAVAQSDLSGVQKGILQYSRIWWKKDQGCHIFESYDTWAKNCGLSRRALINNINTLEDLGWLVRTGKTYPVKEGRPVIEYRLAFGKNHKQSASGTEQSASGTEQSASGTEQSARGAHKSIGVFSSLEESEVKEDTEEVRDEEEGKTAAKAAHQSSLTSDEEDNIKEQSKEEDFANAQSSELSSNNENISDDLGVRFLDQTEKGSAIEQSALDALCMEGDSTVKIYEGGAYRDETNEEAWLLIEEVYPTYLVDRQFGYVDQIMREVRTSGGSVEEVANRLGHKKLVAAFEW